MRLLRISILMLGGCLLSLAALHAAEVSIVWQEPETFRDIEAGNLMAQKQFQQRVIDELGRHIKAAADQYLPDQYRLNMTVTDVDLAGDVEYFFTRFPDGIRIVRDLYFPSIEFTYELTDETGTVRITGQENVRDIGFQFAGSRFITNAPFGYEKRMIDKWFRDTFGKGEPLTAD